MAKLLARSIRMTNREARCVNTLQDNDHAIDPVHMISRLYNTLSSDLNLMQAASLDQQELDETPGKVALYEAMTRSYMAKQKLIEYGKGERNLSEEERLAAGKDLLLAAVVAKEIFVFNSQEGDRIASSPEQAENIARIGAADKYKMMTFAITKAKMKARQTLRKRSKRR